MSAFVIFLIVVNIGYLLYYAAIITIDMNSNGKQGENSNLSVDVEGMTDTPTEDDDNPVEEPIVIEESDQNDSPDTSLPEFSLVEDSPDQEPEVENVEVPDNVIPVDNTEDNPYGLTDEEDDSDVNEEHTDDSINSNEAPSNTPEPEVQVFEPQPSDLANKLNAQSEPITAESTFPVRPDMMATTLLRAHGLIKQELMKESSESDDSNASSTKENSTVDNGISYETEVFDKI